jgi:hypothetical protein
MRRMKEVITMPKKKKIDHLLEMTANDWVHNSNYDIPFEVKDGFTLLAGYMERYLSNKYEYETEWDRNEDVFIRIFDNYPIDKTHRKIELRVSFHKRFVQVGYDGRMICNMYISTAKAPVVGFLSAPTIWEETHKIQEAFGQIFQNIFKKENVI